MEDAPDKDQPKFNQGQYDMLLRCSKSADMKEWNDWRTHNPEEMILLERVDLEDRLLGRARFERADLRDAHVKGAYLYYAHLEGASLAHANLETADLMGANLEGADLTSANLKGADLTSANLKGASLERASLEGAFFTCANLEGADLTDANLKGASLAHASLEGAHLTGANLEGADFGGANLEGADLTGANLEGADLAHASLQGAHLTGANLERAHLTCANLENADVTGARLNDKTKCRGIRVVTCYGSPQFKRQAADQDFLEELQSTQRGKMIYYLWLWLADCGRSFLRPLLWSLGIAALFALVFYALGPSAFEVENLPESNFLTMFYYSIVTFTTLGFGDVTPNTLTAAMIVMVEVILGYVMLGMLISVLANKVARRSGL